MKTISRTSILFWLIWCFAFSIHAQSAAMKQSETQSGINIQDFKLNSKLMAREMPYRVVFPKNYSSAKTEKFPVIYLLHGYSGHFDNWTDKTDLKKYAADYNYIIVTPEGNNGWYSDSAKVSNDKYESYIIQELIPEIDKNFRTIAARESRVIGGLSMGGFGAMKLGIKYPQMFALAGSFSGAIAASSYRNSNEIPSGALRTTLLDTFGEPESETHKANNLFKITSEMSPEKIASLPFLYLDCGTEDELGLLQINKMFADILVQRKIPHEFRQLPGKHNWEFWNSQVLEFLQLSDKILMSAKAKTK
jgi:putative tributyrin esterase